MNEDLNLKLQQVVGRILARKDIWNEEIHDIQNTYIRDFYKVLKTAFRATISPQNLKEHVISGNHNDQTRNIFFITKTIENEATYILLNYYIINFLNSLNETINEDVISVTLRKQNITPKDIENALHEYDLYTKNGNIHNP